MPALTSIIHANRGRLFKTILNNAVTFGFGPNFVMLAEHLEKLKPDLLLADFEPFAPAAADMLGIPVVALNHQQIVTETVYRVPQRYRLSTLLTGAAVRVLSPLRAQHTLISSFFTLRSSGRCKPHSFRLSCARRCSLLGHGGEPTSSCTSMAGWGSKRFSRA